MKKFTINLILFSLLTAILYTALVVIFQLSLSGKFKPNIQYKTGWWGHINSRLAEVKTVRDVDILFLGSSHTYRGYDTRIFRAAGYNTFNLGTSAQTVAQSLHLLERYYDRVNPKVVVLEASPIVFSYKSLESTLDIIANDRNDIHSLNMAMQNGNIKIMNTLIYAYVSDLIGWEKGFKEARKRGADTYVDGGYVEKEYKSFRNIYHQPKSYEFKDFQKEAFEKVINFLNSKNCKTILVQTPITATMNKSINDKPAFDSLMSRYSDYYNFNELITLDDSIHFYDAHHLNQLGVDSFNAVFIDRLERDNKFQGFRK